MFSSNKKRLDAEIRTIIVNNPPPADVSDGKNFWPKISKIAEIQERHRKKSDVISDEEYNEVARRGYLSSDTNQSSFSWPIKAFGFFVLSLEMGSFTASAVSQLFGNVVTPGQLPVIIVLGVLVFGLGTTKIIQWAAMELRVAHQKARIRGWYSGSENEQADAREATQILSRHFISPFEKDVKMMRNICWCFLITFFILFGVSRGYQVMGDENASLNASSYSIRHVPSGFDSGEVALPPEPIDDSSPITDEPVETTDKIIAYQPIFMSVIYSILGLLVAYGVYRDSVRRQKLSLTEQEWKSLQVSRSKDIRSSQNAMSKKHAEQEFQKELGQFEHCFHQILAYEFPHLMNKYPKILGSVTLY